MCCSAAAARATRPHAQPARHHCGHTALERNRPTVRVHVGVRAWNEIVHACVWGRGGATASAHVCLCVWACNCKCTCAVCGAGSGGSTGRLPAAAYGGAGRTYGSGGRRVDLSLDGHAPAEVEEVELKHRIAEPALSPRSRETAETHTVSTGRYSRAGGCALLLLVGHGESLVIPERESDRSATTVSDSTHSHVQAYSTVHGTVGTVYSYLR